MASIFDKVKQVAGQVGFGVRNLAENVLPVTRAVAPIVRGVRGAEQAINPWDTESAGNRLINDTSNYYGVTPAFKRVLDQQNPTYGTAPIDSGGGLKAGNAADGMYENRGGRSPWDVSGIQVGRVAGNDARQTMLHEGLHAQWENDPSIRDKFINTYNASATPDLRSYLVKRLSDYSGWDQVPTDALMNLGHLSPQLQTEVHSYLPEYFDRGGEEPAGFQDYYSQFYKRRLP